MTGEKVDRKWRVVRLENRYREKNFPFVEFPTRYIEKLIEALQAAHSQIQREESEEMAEMTATEYESAQRLC